jgi:hypothetical protein
VRDPEGFTKAITELFEKFHNEPSTIRVEFKGVNRVVIGGGRNFSDPKTVECNREQLPKDVLEQIALLDVAGEKRLVGGIGRKLWNDIYYIDMTPARWDEFKKGIGR